MSTRDRVYNPTKSRRNHKISFNNRADLTYLLKTCLLSFFFKLFRYTRKFLLGAINIVVKMESEDNMLDLNKSNTDVSTLIMEGSPPDSFDSSIDQ